MLAEAGLEISAGKMSSWWAGTPPTMRLEELDVLCSVLGCTPSDLMTPEPEKVAGRRPGRPRPSTAPARAAPRPRRSWRRGSAGRGPSRPCEPGPGTGGAPAAAADVHPLPVQPGRLGPPARGLLLRLPPGRALHRAAVLQVRHRQGLLQPGHVRRLPSREPPVPGLVQGLPGLRRLPPPQLHVLALPLVALPLPARGLRLLRPHRPHRRAGEPAGSAWNRPGCSGARPRPGPDRGQPRRPAALLRQPELRPPRHHH
ncbi:helix-turn-helix domain-containing protein [Paenarthrobacter sp. C1]|uniref:helix-turn-helix domain-containing protein n=1 Tax=Paenarthrobacter sp. C1 TaxID=3400220 RepID=UPI003BF5D043